MRTKMVLSFRLNSRMRWWSHPAFRARTFSNSARMKGETTAAFFPSRANSRTFKGGLFSQNNSAEPKTLVSTPPRNGFFSGIIDQPFNILRRLDLHLGGLAPAVRDQFPPILLLFLIAP